MGRLSQSLGLGVYSNLRIGVDIGGTKIEALALDPAGREVFRKRIPTPRGDYAATLAAVAGLVKEIGDGTVGIGIPGALSRATGLVKNANSTWLIGRPLQQDLEKAIGREVRLGNDANCFALSEAVDGAGQGARVVFGVILGTGVGGGIVVDAACSPGRTRSRGNGDTTRCRCRLMRTCRCRPAIAAASAASRPTCRDRASRAITRPLRGKARALRKLFLSEE